MSSTVIRGVKKKGLLMDENRGHGGGRRGTSQTAWGSGLQMDLGDETRQDLSRLTRPLRQGIVDWTIPSGPRARRQWDRWPKRVRLGC